VLLRQHGEPLVDRADPFARRLVLVDTRASEGPQAALKEPGGQLVEPGRVHRGEDLVELAVQAQLGREFLDLLPGQVGALPDRLVGVHLGQQGGGRARTPSAEGDLHVVPCLQGRHNESRHGRFGTRQDERVSKGVHYPRCVGTSELLIGRHEPNGARASS
jgi:hypothetical protein